MDGAKSLLASRTCWGGAVAVASGILSLFGYAVSESDQVDIAAAIAGIGSLLGGIVAVYGRIRATKRVEAPVLRLTTLSGAVLLLSLVTGCGFTPQGEIIRGEILQQGAKAYDAGIDNAEVFVCQAASVGSIKRRYWRSQQDFDTWVRFCEIGAGMRALRLGQGQPQEASPAAT
jgi:hypothetical protein